MIWTGDAVIPLYPLCVHAHISAAVNSMALRLAGIDRNTPDPPGGEIERDENGEPTGVLKENARNLIARAAASGIRRTARGQPSGTGRGAHLSG